MEINGALLEEVIRDTLGAVVLVAFFVVIYFASRRFIGERGRVPTRGGAIFFGICALVLLILLVFRRANEDYLAQAVSPLRRFLASPEANWPERAVIGLFRLVIVTIAMTLIIQIVGRLYWYSEGRLERWHASQRGLMAHFSIFVIAVCKLGRYVAVLVLVIVFLPVIFRFFPRTQVLLDQSEGYLATPARDVGRAILAYLPNFGYVIVILIIGFYALKLVKYIFTALEKGTLTFASFPSEWAIPTYGLIRTLFFLFLLMVTFPYLPGAKSQFFQGFSVFVGALITFGSTATIGNIVSGTVLTYTRAFKIGDFVTIGDRTGVVIAKNLLVTRLLTLQNEEVSIPNGSVLSTSVLNYSARAKEGLVLTVSAGIGYDVDWRKVQQLMIDGARATENIMANPAPRVYQSAFGDYAVNYELRAFTEKPVLMLETLSHLRANVLDAFNRAGVEIMTPSIFAHRDASHLAVPPEQFRVAGMPRGIAVDVRGDGTVSASA